MSNLAESLASATALDSDRRLVTLGQFWRDEPAVVAFVRHFG